MPRQKQNHQIKKIFSRNTPPSHLNLELCSEEKYKVYCLLLSEETQQVYCPPPAFHRAANRRRAPNRLRLGGSAKSITLLCNLTNLAIFPNSIIRSTLVR